MLKVWSKISIFAIFYLKIAIFDIIFKIHLSEVHIFLRTGLAHQHLLKHTLYITLYPCGVKMYILFFKLHPQYKLKVILRK